MRPIYLLLISIIFCFSSSAQIRANFIETATRPSAQEIEEYRTSIWENLPSPDGWTNDFEGIFSLEEEATLSSMIEKLEQRTGIEIAVVTIDSNMVDVEKFQEFADRLMAQWGVGKKEKENGIVICISSQYRKIAISRGPGTDKYLTDPLITHLILKSFIPLYKKQNYFGGTLNGLTALINKLQPSI